MGTLDDLTVVVVVKMFDLAVETGGGVLLLLMAMVDGRNDVLVRSG